MDSNADNVTLPSFAQGAARARAARAALDEFAAKSGNRVFNWLVLPRLATLIDSGIAEEQAAITEQVPDWQLRRIRRGQRRIKMMRETEQENASVAGEVLFMATNEEMERSQEPIVERLGDRRDTARARMNPVRARTQRFTKRASEFTRDFIAEMLSAGVELPFDSPEIVRIWLRAAGQLAYWEHVLDEDEVKAVVTGTTAGPRGRALIVAARREGIPSIYIPHSPILGDLRRNDLPVDFAGLRSEREAALIASAGAPRDRLTVVGDPTTVVAERPERDADGPVLLIVPPFPEAVLEGLFEVVRAAAGDGVILAAEAGGGSDALEVVPSGWRVAEEPVAELLAAGPAAVIQHSGEVAAEALRVGIPVIELELGGHTTTYPILDTPLVPRAGDSTALRSAIDAARSASGDEIAAWAAEWSSPTGEEAAERAVALIRDASERDARPGPIWDAWDPSGAGLETEVYANEDDEEED